jgi:hypothetical protein
MRGASQATAGVSATMLSDLIRGGDGSASRTRLTPAILEQHALGDFDLKALRIETGLHERCKDRRRHVAAPEVDRRPRRRYAPITESVGLAAQGSLSPASSRERRAMPRLTSQACRAAPAFI